MSFIRASDSVPTLHSYYIQPKIIIKTSATLIREGKVRKEIPIEEIEPVDNIHLSAGDMIPADCRVIASTDLFISESMLTGESLPVEKMPKPVTEVDQIQPIELNNLCFMGTNVVSGSAIAVVVKIGRAHV